MDEDLTYSAFVGQRLLVSGSLRAMLAEVKKQLDRAPDELVLIFEDQTGKQVDFDFRGSLDEVLSRADAEAPRPGPGRPRLGVVSREVSLLPRHWAWLEQQPGGISGALRRLVDEARKRAPDEERARLAREAASRVMTAMAGDLPGYEEASRALFADRREELAELVRPWPAAIRDYILRLLSPAARPGGTDPHH